MKFIFVLAFFFTVVSCSEFDGIQRLNVIFGEQMRVKGILAPFVEKFTLDFNSVVVFHQLVNQLELTSRDLPAAQTFLDYIKFTYELQDRFERETVYPYQKRFQDFRVLYEVQDGLSDKQKYAADAVIENAIEQTVDRKLRIVKYLNDMSTELSGIEEKVDAIKRALVSVEKAASEHNDDSVKLAFEELKKSTQIVLDLIGDKTLKRSLFSPMNEAVKTIDDILDELAKKLRKITVSLDWKKSSWSFF